MTYRPGYRFSPETQHIYKRRWDHALEPLQQLPRQVVAIVHADDMVEVAAYEDGAVLVRYGDTEGWLG